MATWILGDIHGCPDELAEMLERLDLGPDDLGLDLDRRRLFLKKRQRRVVRAPRPWKRAIAK